jgi:hypothetical protein
MNGDAGGKSVWIPDQLSFAHPPSLLRSYGATRGAKRKFSGMTGERASRGRQRMTQSVRRVMRDPVEFSLFRQKTMIGIV